MISFVTEFCYLGSVKTGNEAGFKVSPPKQYEKKKIKEGDVSANDFDSQQAGEGFSTWNSGWGQA